MPKIPDAERLQIIATYRELRAAGVGVQEAARAVGSTPTTLNDWIEQAESAAIDDMLPAPVAKIRRCLRCSRPFKSSGPGNRICNRPSCRRDHVHEGLPADWATATMGVAD